MQRQDGASGNPGKLLANEQLLFGIIALQANFLTREQLVAGFDAWVYDKSQSLSHILEMQGALAKGDREALQVLVDRFLKKHGDDAEKSLAALGEVAPQVAPDLAQLHDTDVTASLGFVGPQTLLVGPRSEETVPVTRGLALGQFRILRLHAKGGLGQVSVALDQELNREVALKEIQPRHADDPISRERFVLEAEITGGLEHPGIVPIYALGRSPDGRPYYAMRFIKGDTLKEAIDHFHQPDNPNRQAPGARQLELRQLLGRFIDVCNAMEYAHSRGVVHRDLKPGNVMVGKYGETLVVDWGLAKARGKSEIVGGEAELRPLSALSSSGQTQHGSAIGTPSYMSPEQSVGNLEEIGPASDVYSLGATLYHVLCGRPPFEKEDLLELLAKVRRGDFPKPRAIVPEVPAALEAICLKAMSVQPGDRYSSVRSLADDLEHWLADEPIAAAPESPRERLLRFERKHRGVVRATGAATALVAVIAVVAAIWVNSARHAALDLAGNNERLAKERGRLADENAQLAVDERATRQAAERQLRIATAERLAAQSRILRRESPQRSGLLAIAAVETTRAANEPILPLAREELCESIEALGGTPLIGHYGAIVACAFSPDGKWLATGDQGQPSSVRLWDLTAARPFDNSRVLRGHTGRISVLAITPDSDRLVTASPDGTARLWNLKTADPAQDSIVLRGHDDEIWALQVSSDNHWLVTASDDTTARLWDLTATDPSANPVVLKGHEGTVHAVAISPDNHWIVTGSEDKTARVWDLQSGHPAENPHVLAGHQDVVRCLAISPDSRRLVTGSLDKTARLWDLTAADPSSESTLIAGHDGAIVAVTVSPDGRWIVTGSTDRTVRLASLAAAVPSSASIVLRGYDAPIRTLAISQDGRRLAVGTTGGNAARVYNLTTADPAADPIILRGHEGGTMTLAMSRDGTKIATGGFDKTPRLFDLTAIDPSDRTVILRTRDKLITTVNMSSNGRWLATVYDHRIVTRWDLAAQNPSASSVVLNQNDQRIDFVAVSPDGRWIAAGDYEATARLWDLSSPNPTASSKVLLGHDGIIRALAMSPDSRRLATGGSDHTVRVWDLTAPDPSALATVLRGHDGFVTALAFDSESHWLATGSDDGLSCLWDLTADDLSQPDVILSGIKADVAAVAFSPDDRRLITSEGFDNDSVVRVWELTATDPSASPIVLRGGEFGYQSVAISTDGRWLAAGGEDNSPWLWDLADDDPASTACVLRGHHGYVSALAFHPDVPRLVTGSRDGTARIWDLDVETQIDRVRAAVGRDLTQSELETYFLDAAPPGTRLDPRHAAGYLEKGQLLIKRGKLDEAFDNFSRAIRLDPPFADALVKRAEELYNTAAWHWATSSNPKQRDGNLAVQSATKACELSQWRDWREIDTLAAAHAEAGSFEEAVKRQTQALVLGAENAADAGELQESQARLELYKSGKPFRQR